jgi:hypothetical protein
MHELIVFLSGFLIGYILSYFYSKHVLMINYLEKFKDELLDEIQKIKTHLVL